MKRVIAVCISVAVGVAGCATVRQSDLDAWVGVPVIALDTHSLLLGYPMIKTITDTGIEIRNYSEKIGVSSCAGGGIGSVNSPREVLFPTQTSIHIRVAYLGWWDAMVSFIFVMAR